jgi:hypothetical protein
MSHAHIHTQKGYILESHGRSIGFTTILFIKLLYTYSITHLVMIKELLLLKLAEMLPTRMRFEELA